MFHKKGSGQVPQRSLSSTSGISYSRSFHPSHPTLGNHEPTTLFGTILHLPKPFPPHSWEPWSTQIPFHASFLAFPDPSHPTLGNHEAPKPFFMLHFLPSQAFPTPLLGTMRNARTPFHVSLLAFPSPSHPTLGNHDYMNSGFRSPLLRFNIYVYIYIHISICKVHPEMGWCSMFSLDEEHISYCRTWTLDWKHLWILVNTGIQTDSILFQPSVWRNVFVPDPNHSFVLMPLTGHSLQMYGAAIHAAKVGHQWPLALSIHDKERMWVND